MLDTSSISKHADEIVREAKKEVDMIESKARARAAEVEKLTGIETKLLDTAAWVGRVKMHLFPESKPVRPSLAPLSAAVVDGAYASSTDDNPDTPRLPEPALSPAAQEQLDKAAAEYMKKIGVDATCMTKLDRISQDGNVMVSVPLANFISPLMRSTGFDIPVELATETHLDNHPRFLHDMLVRNGVTLTHVVSKPPTRQPAAPTTRKTFVKEQPVSKAVEGQSDSAASGTGGNRVVDDQKVGTEGLDEIAAGPEAALAGMASGRASA